MTAVYDNDTKIASNTNTYNLINFEQTIENGQFTANVEKMEGMDTIWVFDAEENAALDISYRLNVSSGKMKLVLIDPDGEIQVLVKCDSEMEASVQTTVNVDKGNNRIKIVADENTKFDIDLSIAEGEFRELG